MKKSSSVIGLLCLFCINTAVADAESDVAYLQQRWAEVNYQLEDSTQLSAFELLMAEVDEMLINNDTDASTWIWSGIINSTYAGARGGLGALKFAKKARGDLERAMELDPSALQGSAYTSLGTLYLNVPGWPIGFGSDKKAEELLLQSLALNPEGIDSNYFYGAYLMNEKRYQEAEDYLLKAQQAPARLNRPVADAGRQDEILQALNEIRARE